MAGQGGQQSAGQKTAEQVAAEKAEAEKAAAEQKADAEAKAKADADAKPKTKPKGYKVIGAAVVMRGEDKSERYLYQGAVFDEAAFSEDSVKHNLSVGLIEKVK